MDKGQSMSPIIIYCRTLKAVGRVYSYLKNELGEGAWVDKDTKANNLLIAIFLRSTFEIKSE